MNITKCLEIKNLISNADAIVIGAGAGLSASAGLDYSSESFARYFPELVEQYGMTDMYSSGFYDFKTEEQRWSYWAKHINYSFIAPPSYCAYQNLFDIVKDKSHFVITTNVDGQFFKAGFDKNNVFEVQGSYGRMQCAVACHNKVYSNVEVVLSMLKSKNKLEVDEKLIPYCPVCGGKMDMHLRKDNFFVQDKNWESQCIAYEKFISKYQDKNIILIELGVGFNTPGIIRFPFEKMVEKNKNIKLVRINNSDMYSYVDCDNRLIYLQGDCAEIIKQLLNT